MASKPCVGCGVCCRMSRCSFSRIDVDGGCRYQVPWTRDHLPQTRYRCGIYDQIKDHPDAKISPAFGVGCSHASLNYRRRMIVRELSARGEIPEGAE